MGSIDDFWRQLNVKKGPKATLSGLSNIPGLTTHSRTLPAKGSASPSVPAPQFAAALATSGLPDQQGLQVCNRQKTFFISRMVSISETGTAGKHSEGHQLPYRQGQKPQTDCCTSSALQAIIVF